VTDMPIADAVRGRDGRTLAEAWDGSPEAYKGAAVSGFPNLFLLVGPNTGLGHNSIVFMIESQVDYVGDALATMRRRGAGRVEVLPEAQTAYNADVQRLTEGTVWVSGGCASYYIDRNGRNSSLWPTFSWPFRTRTREFDAGAYLLDAPASA
jgi:cation diffusion facilitator CzcD-associated flavoprotein CzcO